MSTPPEQLPRDLPFPPLQERRVLGRPVSGYDLEDAGILPRSFWQRINAAWNDTWDLTASRWRQLFEPDDEYINTKEFQQIAGDSGVKFRLNMTRAEAERRVDLARREAHAARFESGLLSDLIGGAVPALFDPVSVATLPLGTANFVRAASAKTWSGLLAQNAIGGAKAGIVAFPVEIAFQQGERESLNTGMLLGATLGPPIAAPLLGAAGRGIRASIDGALLHAATRNKGTNVARPPDETINVFERADAAGASPPPPLTRQTEMATPTAKLKAMFDDYEGGYQQWVRDLGLRRQAAIDKANALGIDPRSIEIRSLLETLSRNTDARFRTSVDYNMRLLDILKQHREGKANAAEAVFLQTEGLVHSNGRDLTILGRRLVKAIDENDQTVLQRFLANGPPFLRNAFRRYEDNIFLPDDLRPQSDNVFAEDVFPPSIFDGDDLIPQPSKKRDVFDESDLLPQEGVDLSPLVFDESDLIPQSDGVFELGPLDGLPKVIGDVDNPGVVIQHLEAAMLNRKHVEPKSEVIGSIPRVPEPEEPGARSTPVQEEIELIVKTAEQQGVETASVRDTLREMREAMKRCGEQ